MSDDITAVIQEVADAQADTTDAPTDPTPESADTTPETPAATETPAVTDPPASTEDDEVRAIEQDLVAKTPTLSRGRIPLSRHQAVLTRARNQAKAEAEARIAELTKQYEPLKQYEAPEYKARVEQALRVAEIAEREPARFLQILRTVPEYQPLFAALATEAAQQPAASAAPEQEPQPDTILPDGTLGYSADGAKKLLEFRLRKANEEFAKQIDGLRNEIKPIQEERQTATQINAAFQRQRAVLTDARATWPGFTDHESVIYAELTRPGNERLSLEEAYRRVVVPRLAGDRAKLEADIRASVLKELAEKNRAPHSVRTTLPPATGGDSDPSNEIAAIIRSEARRLSASA